eukprot:m.62140 g.62140  ORF g.62140 m.62140 type:complete len:59 (-) comp11487_c0_seq3:2112-2288(-)
MGAKCNCNCVDHPMIYRQIQRYTSAQLLCQETGDIFSEASGVFIRLKKPLREKNKETS